MRQELALQQGVGDASVEDTLTAGASGGTDFPLSDRGRAWDAGAANKRWQAACGIDGEKGDWAKFHTGFFWYDSSDPDKVTSHKLPFVDVVDGKTVAVWRGVTAGAARLGSTQVPGGDKPKIQSRMSSYYSKAAKQYDDPTIKAPWAAASAAVRLNISEEGYEAAVKTLLQHVEFDADPAVAPEEMQAQLNAAFGKFAEKMSGKCADCGHMAMAHGGDSNMGACSMGNCSCKAFDSGNDNDADDDGNQQTSVAEPFVFAVGTNDSLLDVTLTGPGFFDGASGTYVTTWGTGTTSATPVVFTFEGGTEYAGPHGKGRGGRRGWKNIRIPATEPVRNIGGDAVSPNAAETAAVAEVPLPAEHQPGSQLPVPNPSPSAPDASLPPAGALLSWTAVLAPEGHATDDGRVFAPGSITWRELPLTLMGMLKTADGHDGAEVCGRIERIWRDGDLIRASGVFDSGEYGQKIASLVNDGTLRGVSVDIAPQKVDMAYRSEVVDEDGKWLDTAPEESSDDAPSPLDLLFGGDSNDPVIYVVRKAVLGMATVCPFQAFADAKIEPAASLVAAASDAVWTVTGQAGWVVVASSENLGLSASAATAPADPTEATPAVEVITASAAGLTTDTPPLAWFDPPKLPDLTALTVDDDGRIYGHAAAWGTCHIGIPGECTTAPHSMTNYSYFHLKEVVCDDGARVNCGTVTMDTGHAGQSLGRAAAAAHYDDTGCAVADVVCGEDEFGVWVAGAVRPGADAEAVRRLRGAALSGDWRNVNGNLELVALLAVNVPGFPIPRVRAELTASAAGLELTSLTAAGAHLGLDGLTVEQRSQWAELSTIAADEWGRLNRLALES